MKKSSKTIKPKQTGKNGVMTIESFQDIPQVITKQEKKTIELEAGNVPNPHNTISDAKTELKNLSQRGQDYIKNIIKGSKSLAIGQGILIDTLDLNNRQGSLSKKGKAEIIEWSQCLKNLSGGIDTSEYFLANQSLSKQVKNVQEKQGKNKDNPLKRKEMFKLLEVGKNMSKSVKAVQIDTAREVSQEAKEKRRIAEENKAKKEADAIFDSHCDWFNSMSIDEFDARLKERKIFQRKFVKSLTK